MAKSGIVVIKLGGDILRNDILLKKAIEGIRKATAAGNRVVVVHGAGAQIDERFKEKGVSVEKIGGERVTTNEGIKIVYNAAVEESRFLRGELLNAGIRAKAFSLPLVLANKSEKLGYVGSPIGVDTKSLNSVLRKGNVAIVSFTGVTKKNEIVNINADFVASFVARALRAKLLEMKTKKAGVLKDGRTIPKLSISDAKKLMDEFGNVAGIGPKLSAAITAAKSGVPVRISCFTSSKGTVIKPAKRFFTRRR